MLWATGTGSEIMQPMAAPVLGGILVADEVVDLLLPVLFYRVRARRWKRKFTSQELPLPQAMNPFVRNPMNSPETGCGVSAVASTETSFALLR